jgi:ribonuclease Y
VEPTTGSQAGGVVRVIVTPERVYAAAAVQHSEEIARRIQSALPYPGQIRVVVIRETRAVGVAK